MTTRIRRTLLGSSIGTLSALLLSHCGSSSFTSSSGAVHKQTTEAQVADGTAITTGTLPDHGVDTCSSQAAPSTLTVAHTFAAGAASCVVTVNYKRVAAAGQTCAAPVSYTTDGTPVVTLVSGTLSQAQAQLFAAFVYHATLGTSGGTTTFTETVQTHGVTSGTTSVKDQVITLTQASSTQNWAKDEGTLGALGALSSSTPGGAACPLTSNGNKAKSGVYAVILTNPAPCDFVLPTVTVSRNSNPISVAIGTYWQYNGSNSAHSFPVVKTPQGAPDLDNGFILVQPDHKSYLLVDAGLASPDRAQYQTTEVVAKQLSASLGFGDTTLMQPQPGTAANQYADATVFKSGSVIAVYDDTPDMAGNIDTAAIVAAARSESGFDLSWTAKAAQP